MVEALEDRCLLASFIVDSTGDQPDINPGNGVCDTQDEGGPCTLLAAIQEANALTNSPASTPDEIRFNIVGAGVQTIQTNGVPEITDPVIIDGYTQPGSRPNTLTIGDDAVLLIELQGTGCCFGRSGLTISAGDSIVRGLVINDFDENGITLRTKGRNRIEGNFMGTNASGTRDQGQNGRNDVAIEDGSSNNTIGGTTPAGRNILSGDKERGISISGLGTSGNVIQGNYLGLNAAGDRRLGELRRGISIDFSQGVDGTGASNNLIGGTEPGAGNVISGTGECSGISIDDSGSTGNVIQGNLIGTDATGHFAFLDGQDGICLGQHANNTTIGGTTASARNVISGNLRFGIVIAANISGTLVQGNFIGTDIDGTSPLGNLSAGVIIFDSSDNTIGGAAQGAGNLISGNGSGLVFSAVGGGIYIGGNTSTGNVVQGNRIGTDVTGTRAIGNFGPGVQISGAPGNVVGGTAVGAGNVIAGNTSGGVLIQGSSATGNLVQGNFIGTNAAGMNLANSGNGGVVLDAAPDNLIGGTTAGAGNTIAFNEGAGVAVLASTGNTILGNSIHSSGGLGIDLRNNGVTLNDANDADTGANNLQNFPLISSVSTSGGNTTIQGTLQSTPTTEFRVEFFASAQADASGFGEGQTFLGFSMVTTDANGNANFAFNPPAPVPAGLVVTATATDPNNNTSEFSGTPVTPVTPTSMPPASFTVLDVRLLGATRTIDAVRVSFSADLRMPGAEDLSSFVLRTQRRAKRSSSKSGRLIEIGSAQYDPAARTVDLVSARPLRSKRSYQLTVVAFGAVIGASGERLDGNGDGFSGDDFRAIIGGGGSKRVTLTVDKSGTGTGSVTSSTRGINCGNDCNQNFKPGQRVTLTARPDLGSTFVEWTTGGCTGAGTCTVTLNANTTVTAKFETLPRFDVAVSTGGSGSGTVMSTPPGINCGVNCSESFFQGQQVRLIARPANGSIFAGWSGGCSGTGTCTVTMNADSQIEAFFLRPGEIIIDSLTDTSAQPGSLLTINGIGFNPSADLAVRFSTGSGFSVDVALVEATATSLTLAVPPFLDPITKNFGPGTVNVTVVESSGVSIVVSNSLTGFGILDLPTSGLPAGMITLGFLRGAVTEAEQQMAVLAGSVMDTAALNAAIARQLVNLRALANDIQSVVDDPSRSFTLGIIDETTLTIGAADLATTDRILLSMLQELGSTASAISSAIGFRSALRGASGPNSAGCSAPEALAASQAASNNQGDRYLADVETQLRAYRVNVLCAIPNAFNKAYQVVQATGAVAIGFLLLAGASPIAVALPTAALVHVTVVGGIGTILVGGALGQTTAGARELVQFGGDQIEGLFEAALAKLGIHRLAGDRGVGLAAIIAGGSALMEAFGAVDMAAPPPAARITVSPTSGLVTTEAGGQSFFEVSLNRRPSDVVSINLGSNKPSEGTASPATLIFNPSNWFFPQKVTVTGVADTLKDGNRPYTIITSQAVSTDPNYNGLNPPDVSVTNIDNEATLTGAWKGTGSVPIVLTCDITRDLTWNLTQSGNSVTGTFVDIFTVTNSDNPDCEFFTGSREQGNLVGTVSGDTLDLTDGFSFEGTFTATTIYGYGGSVLSGGGTILLTRQPALQVVTAATPREPNTSILSQEELVPNFNEALTRWATSGLGVSNGATLGRMSVQVANLPGSYLGVATPEVIYLDRDAAGYGWFIDPTPCADEEYEWLAEEHILQAGPESPAANRVDLLTVLSHELGHMLGLEDLDPLDHPHELMTSTLGLSLRRVPTAEVVDWLLASDLGAIQS